MSDEPPATRPRRRTPRADAGPAGQARPPARERRRPLPGDRRADDDAGRRPRRAPRPAAGHDDRRAGRRHRAGHLLPQHRQAVLRDAARGRRRTAGDALPRPGRRGVPGGLEGRRRPGRPRARHRRGRDVAPRRALGLRRLLAADRQGAAPAAGGAQADERGTAGPPPLRRPHRAGRGPPHRAPARHGDVHAARRSRPPAASSRSRRRCCRRCTAAPPRGRSART